MMDEQWAREHIGTTPAVGMTADKIAVMRDAIESHPHFGLGGDALSVILDDLEAARVRIAQLEAQRGVAVVEFADHRFSVNCDTAQKGGNQAIYVNNDTTGVGYQIAGTDIDGHFKRKTWDLTPYMRPFIETIGIRPIPADRVLADGMMGVDRFGTGFVEACGILAAKPFDRPTTAACLIREGGMVSSLLATTSDGPGISILREEMRSELDALRGAKGGEVAG